MIEQYICLFQDHNFEKYEWDKEVISLDTPYDYGSLMHYGSKDFSDNEEPTILPKVEGVSIGQREALSDIDITEVRKFYSC